MLISLIVATYNRSQELKELLESLTKQTYKNFEVLIVDQNDELDITPMVTSFTGRLNIKHIKSSRKGIAFNKNLGIKHAQGELVTFPDDDCTYYPETIQHAYDFSRANKDVDMFYGRIYDIETKTNIIRNWSTKPIKLNRFNFHNNNSAITCFNKRKELLFDENFGVGSKYGSGEEFDYIMNALNRGYTVVYTPDVSIWHPLLHVTVMSNDKVYYYAKGYGAIFRKNLNFTYGLLFCFSLSFQIIQSLITLLKADFTTFNKRRIAFKGRLVGFFTFKQSINTV